MEKNMSLCRSFLRNGFLMFTLITLFHGLAFGAVMENRQTVGLKLGQSQIITTLLPFKRVAIASDNIADVVVLSPTEAYIYGKTLGYTSVILWEEGKSKTLLDVVVSLDLTALKEKIHQLYPDQQIKVHGTETGIVLSGIVSGPEIAEQAVRLATAYMPTAKGKGGGCSSVTNLLDVSGIQQVMLEVKFAEVNRSSQKNIQAGLAQGKLKNFVGNIGIEDVLSNLDLTNWPEMVTLPSGLIGNIAKFNDYRALVQAPNSLLMNFADAPNIFVNINNFTAALKLLEDEGLARIMAEPKLVTQSGHEASFLAGGEFPIPVYDDDGITITFKEFGVGLAFTPYILSNGKISLHVAPSVSEIASTSIIPAGIQGTNFIVPNLATRKLSTTVELYDGQTLALAGLLQDTLRETVVKIPGLGDIPILGVLFRSSSYLQSKTDLLITVTPHLIKPVAKDSIVYPGEEMTMPNNFQFYLLGKFEGTRSAAEAEIGEGGLEGKFGHQLITSD